MALVDLRSVSGRLVAGAAVLVVIAAAVGGWLVLRPDPAGDRGGDAGGAGSERADDGDGPVPEHVLNDTGHGVADDDGDPAMVWYLQLSTLPLEDVTRLIAEGVGSDLPPAQQAAARDVASRFVAADLSGAGRDQFPDWAAGAGTPAAPARACCRDVRILAAGAARYAAQPPLSLALVVWSATPVDGRPPFDAWEASFVFLAPGRDGGFTPVDPSTVASWEAPPGLGQPSAR
jgi:hypothetical protein